MSNAGFRQLLANPHFGPQSFTGLPSSVNISLKSKLRMPSHQLAQIINSSDAGKGVFSIPWKGGFLFDEAMSNKPYFMRCHCVVSYRISDEGNGPSTVHFSIEVVPSHHSISTPKLGVFDDFEKGRFELLLVGVCKASK